MWFSVGVSANTKDVFGAFLRPEDMRISIQVNEERLMTQCSRMVRQGSLVLESTEGE